LGQSDRISSGIGTGRFLVKKFGDETFIYLLREGQRQDGEQDSREEDEYGTSGSREIQCGTICAREDIGTGACEEDK